MLGPSSKLKLMRLYSCDLDDEDLASLSQLPDLEDLEIPSSQRVTNKGIAAFIPSKHLVLLNLRDTLIKPDATPIIKRLHLKQILLPRDLWTPEDGEHLYHELRRQCRVVLIDKQGKSRTDLKALRTDANAKNASE